MKKRYAGTGCIVPSSAFVDVNNVLNEKFSKFWEDSIQKHHEEISKAREKKEIEPDNHEEHIKANIKMGEKLGLKSKRKLK